MSERDDFLERCGALAAERGWVFSGSGFDLKFDGGRHQKVLLEFFEFEGRALARLHSAIGNARRIQPLKLAHALEVNFGLPHGALAVKDDQLVMVDTLLLEATGEEIGASVRYLAETADHFERTMFGTDDH